MRDNYWNRRRTRRQVMLTGGATVAGLGALATVGCGDDDDDDDESPTAQGSAAATGTPAAAQPKKGGELILANSAIGAQSLDPHKGPTYGFQVWPLFLNRMIRPNLK